MSDHVDKEPIWFLTGSTGVVGSRLAEQITTAGKNVYPLDFRGDTRVNLSRILKVLTLSEISPGVDLVVIHAATNYGRNGDSSDQVTEANVYRPTQFIQTCLSREEFRRVVFINIDTLADRDTSLYARSKYEFRKALKAFEDPRLVVHNFASDFLYHESDRDDKFVPRMVKQMIQSREFPKLDNPGLIRRPLDIDQFVSHIVSELLNSSMMKTHTWQAVVGERKLSVNAMLEIARDRLDEAGIKTFVDASYNSTNDKPSKMVYLRNREENEYLRQLSESDQNTFEVYVEKLIGKLINQSTEEKEWI